MKIRLFISYITFYIFGYILAKNRKEANKFIEIIDRNEPNMVP